MHNNEALYLSVSLQNLIMEKLNQEITEKEKFKKNLTPFLLHEVVEGKISPNIHSMTQNSFAKPSKSLYGKKLETEPKSLQKDNMNPKNVQIEPNSSSQNKLTKTRLRRLTFSSKKQSFTDMSKSKEFFTIDSDLKLSDNQPQFNKIKFNQTIQLSSSPKLSRKISKIKNQPVKLNLKKQSIHEFYDDFESTLRAKKLQEEKERIKTLQFQAFKSQRFKNLKQKFKIHENKEEIISFDFDGSVINFQDDESKDLSIFKEKQKGSPTKDAFRQLFSRMSQRIELKNCNNLQRVKYSQNHQHKVGMPFQTIYNFKNKDLNSILNYEESQGEEYIKIKSEKFQKINQSSFHQSLNISQLPLSSTKNQIESKLSAQVSNQLSFSSSKHLKNQKYHGLIKVFRDSSSGQKSARKEKQAKILHEQKQKQYTNNYQRQISTIPYLELNEGIRYQQEITIHDDQKINVQTTKVRYVAIEKPRNTSQKSVSHHQDTSIKGNLPFRSFLPFTQNDDDQKTITRLNKTISVFSSQGKSFRFYLQKDQKKSDEFKKVSKTDHEKLEFAIFDNPNPIFIKDKAQVKTKLNSGRPLTTQTDIRIHQKRYQNSRQFFQQMPNKSTNILDMKQKMLLKQKQRVKSSHTTRIVK